MIMAFNSYATLRPLSEKTTVRQKMGRVRKKDRGSLKLTLRFDGCHENKHVGRPVRHNMEGEEGRGGRCPFRFVYVIQNCKWSEQPPHQRKKGCRGLNLKRLPLRAISRIKNYEHILSCWLIPFTSQAQPCVHPLNKKGRWARIKCCPDVSFGNPRDRRRSTK